MSSELYGGQDPIALTQLVSWRAFPVRQLTGRPYIYHAYVGRTRPEKTCGHDHRRAARAEQCAIRLARKLNRLDVTLEDKVGAP